MTEAEIERSVDRAVMRRLSTDSDYLNAENAEDQARREQEITEEECARVMARESARPATGATVTTIVHAIGGRSETVSGTVVDHRPTSVIVETDCHGRIVVPIDRIERGA